MAPPLLELRDLHVEVEGTPILRGLDLAVGEGEVHALMGRNGSGKTTLSRAILGHPAYQVTRGSILFRGEDISELATEARAQRGIFLSFQHPVPLPGVAVGHFLAQAVRAFRSDEMAPRDFRKHLRRWAKPLQISMKDLSRYVNDGFSGGEKKRLETLQMALLQPQLAILDEVDSGLDVDALRTVAKAVIKVRKTEPMGVLMITHYQRILTHIQPDRVHVLHAGRIVESGGPELAEHIEESGYDLVVKEMAS